MATPAIVARVSSLQGEVFAKDAKGVMRPLQVGDPVYEGEVLITTDNGRVTLATGDGQSLRVNPGDIVVLDAEVLGEAKPDVTDAALQAPGAEAARIIQAIKSGGNLDDLLEETAAGEAGGSAGGGPSFVRLLRIAEAIDPLSYQFDTGRPAGIASMISRRNT